jgi:hypothetical protein
MHACIRAGFLGMGLRSQPFAEGVQALGIVCGVVVLGAILAVTTLSIYHRRLPHVRWRSFELSFEDCHSDEGDAGRDGARVDAIGSQESECGKR